MRFISIFSGIEAASNAWIPLGWEPVAFAEVDPFCCSLLAERFPKVPNLGDIEGIDWAPWRGKADLLIGGPPCQSFSAAGLRGGLLDPRGLHILNYARAFHEIRPRFGVFENVPGILNERSNPFGHFLAAMVGTDAALDSPLERGRWTDAGVASGPKADAAWRTLDAQFFGLAQQRRRVYLLAAGVGEIHPASVLIEQKGVPGDTPPSAEAGKGAPRNADAPSGSKGFWASLASAFGVGTEEDGPEIADTITANYGRNQGAQAGNESRPRNLVRTVMSSVRSETGHANPRGRKDDQIVVSQALNAQHGRLTPEDAVASALTGSYGKAGNSLEQPGMVIVEGDSAASTPDLPRLRAGCGRGGESATALNMSQDGYLRGSSKSPPLSTGGGVVGQGYQAVAICSDRRLKNGPETVAYSLGSHVGAGRGEAVNDPSKRAEIADKASVRASSGGSSRSHVLAGIRIGGWDSKGSVADSSKVSTALTGSQRSGPQQNCASTVVYQCQGTNVGPAQTLKGQNVTNGVPFTSELRRLTPRECEILQGFPPGWTLTESYKARPKEAQRYLKALRRWRRKPTARRWGYVCNAASELADLAAYLGIPVHDLALKGCTPDGPRYKAIGNSMPVPVIRWIGDKIQEAIS